MENFKVYYKSEFPRVESYFGSDNEESPVIYYKSANEVDLPACEAEPLFRNTEKLESFKHKEKESKHEPSDQNEKDAKVIHDVINLKNLLKMLYDCEFPEPHESLPNVWEAAAAKNKVFSYFIYKKNTVLYKDPEMFLKHIKEDIFSLIENVLKKKWAVKINFTLHCDYWLLNSESAPIAKSQFSYIVYRQDSLSSLYKFVNDNFKEELKADTLKLKEIKWLSLNFSKNVPADNKLVRVVMN